MINCNTFEFTAALPGDGHFWDFGEGGGSQPGPQVITHMYPQFPAMSYTVKYHYKDYGDCEKVISVDCPPTPLLEASCKQDPCGGLCYSFSSNVTSDYLHEWDFGDGTTLSCFCPEVDHCFTNVNTYNNVNTQTTVTVSVGAPEIASITLDHNNCSTGIFIGKTNEETSLQDFTVLPGSNHDGFNDDGSTSNDKNVYVYGRVLVDKHFTFTATNISVEPGGGFDVVKGNKFYLRSSTDVGVLENCPCPWRGIDVNGTLYTEDSRIRDALYAVRPIQTEGSLPSLRLRTTAFNNNYIGLMGSSGEFNLSAFSGNMLQSDGVRDWCSFDVIADPFEPSGGIFSNDRGWAGIFLRGINTFRIPQTTTIMNTFENLANGIFMVNSNAKGMAGGESQPGILQCRFLDMLRGGYPVEIGGHGIYFLDTEGTHFLDQTGLGLEPANPSFLRCEVGILAAGEENGAFGSFMTSKQNLMDEVEVGYRIESLTGSVDASITNNTIRSTADYGHYPIISAGVWIEDRNQLNTNHTIDNNTIVVNQPTQLFGFGVFVRGNFDVNPEFNTVNITHNPNITVELGTSCVHVLQYAGVNVSNNNLTAQQGILSGLRGVYFGGGDDNVALCNNINGPLPDEIVNEHGVNTNASLDVIIRDNWINNFNSGVVFDGDNGTLVDFRCNHLTGTQREGLSYSDDARTGWQTDRGNTWEGNYNDWGAFHDNTNPFFPDNRYYARMNTNEWPPSINYLTGWFFGSSVIPECPFDPACILGELPPESPISEADVSIAQEAVSALPGQIWQAEKYLYAKLKDNPGLLTGNSLMQTFVSDRKNTPLGQFYEIGKSLESLYAVSSEVLLQLQTNESAIRQALDSLEVLDMALAFDPPSPQYDDLVQRRLDAGFEISQLTQQNKQLYDGLHDNRVSLAENLLQINASVAANEIHEINEQDYFEVYLNTLGKDNYEASPTQLATLESIAQQCPEEGGRAVYWAIGLYGHLTGDLMEVQDCPVESRQAGQVITEDAASTSLLMITPNPSGGEARLKYRLSGSGAGYITILDHTGREVARFELTGTTGELILPDFSPGIYLVRLTEGSQLIQTSKFIKF